MATFYSDQITKRDAVPPQRIEAHEDGKVYRKYFSYTVPTGNLALNSLLELVEIQKGSRLMGGKVITSALSSAGGTAGIDIGDGTTVDKYLDGGDVDAAAQLEFNHTAALEFGELVTADFTLTAKVVGEAWVAAGTVEGYIDYLKLG